MDLAAPPARPMTHALIRATAFAIHLLINKTIAEALIPAPVKEFGIIQEEIL
jgi:hypothetical protein